MSHALAHGDVLCYLCVISCKKTHHNEVELAYSVRVGNKHWPLFVCLFFVVVVVLAC